VYVEARRGRHPLPHGRERQLQQLGPEPRRRLLPFGEQQLHALPARVDGVVALILVVLQQRVIPDLVTQLAELVAILDRAEQQAAALRQRALVLLVGLDAAIELVEGALPLIPAGEDRAEVPRVFLVERFTGRN